MVNNKMQYKTRQMAELLAYLQSVPGKHVTVNDICDYFRKQGISVGTTTVYRNLDRMVEQGLVARYTVDGIGSACFEYLGEHEMPANSCYHCKCEKCGKLIHLQCHEVDSLGLHMAEHHGFALDPTRTIFYGICEACRDQG